MAASRKVGVFLWHRDAISGKMGQLCRENVLDGNAGGTESAFS